MKSLPTLVHFPITKIAAALAVCAGLATATAWYGMTVDQNGKPATMAVVADIDPSIPVVTIVGKRLSSNEKEQMAREERRLESQRMTTVSGDAKPRTLVDGAL